MFLKEAIELELGAAGRKPSSVRTYRGAGRGRVCMLDVFARVCHVYVCSREDKGLLWGHDSAHASCLPRVWACDGVRGTRHAWYTAWDGSVGSAPALGWQGTWLFLRLWHTLVMYSFVRPFLLLIRIWWCVM